MTEWSVQSTIITIIQPAYLFYALFCISSTLKNKSLGVVYSGCAAIAIVGITGFTCLLVNYITLPHTQFQVITIVVTIFGVIFCNYKYIKGSNWNSDFTSPILICFSLTMLLIVWTYAPLGTTDPLNTVVSRWVKWLPMDNQLPFFGALALSSGVVPVGTSDPHMGDWLYSDRPPLQTALFMLTPGFLLPTPDAWAYNVAAISFQMLAVFGVWLLTMSLSKSRKVARVAAITSFFTPITIENGTFVWPKLLAASFTLCLAALLFGDRQDDAATTTQRGAVIGALTALAMLSHAGSAFALIGIGLAALFTGRLTLGRESFIGLLTASIVYLPWVYYQNIVNPPGDRLLKWYLADVTVIDPRSLRQTLVDAYGNVTVDQAISARIFNFNQIFRHYLATIADTCRLLFYYLNHNSNKVTEYISHIRENEFYFVISGTGLLGIFFVITPITVIWNELRPVALSIIFTIMFWILFMFKPGAATIHQGAYYLELAVIVLACFSLSKISWKLLITAATLHGCISIIQFGL